MSKFLEVLGKVIAAIIALGVTVLVVLAFIVCLRVLVGAL